MFYELNDQIISLNMSKNSIAPSQCSMNEKADEKDYRTGTNFQVKHGGNGILDGPEHTSCSR